MRVIHIISGLGNGGAEHALLKLVGQSMHLHHEVIALSCVLDLAGRFRALGVPVHSVALRQSGLMWPVRLLVLLRLCIRLRPDVVQTWMYHANVIASVLLRPFLKAPILWGVHHNSPRSPDLSRSALILNRISMLATGLIPEGIVYCSHSSRREHEACGFPARKGAVVPNGFDHLRFRMDEGARSHVRLKLGLAGTDFVVGFVGRDHPVKGIDILMAAIKKVAQSNDGIRLVMLGNDLSTGNEHLRLIIEAAGLVDRVRLLGVCESVEMYMNSFDVLVQSSWQEAFPSVLNEAMLCGVPCICTDVGDSAIIVGELGWRVPPGDVEGLGAAIQEAQRATKDVTAWQRRREECRCRIFNTFSLSTMALHYERLWMDAVRAASVARH